MDSRLPLRVAEWRRSTVRCVGDCASCMPLDGRKGSSRLRSASRGTLSGGAPTTTTRSQMTPRTVHYRMLGLTFQLTRKSDRTYLTPNERVM